MSSHQGCHSGVECHACHDYCGAITPGDSADDIDNANAFDCQASNPPASYLGQPMSTLKDFGAHIVNRSLNDRFDTCAWRRVTKS